MIHRLGGGLLLMAAVVATLSACGGGSSSRPKTPAAGDTPNPASPARAGTTPVTGASGRTAIIGQSSPAPGTQGSPSPAPGTAEAGAGGSLVPGTMPLASPFPNITVNAGGTATNPEGTPVALPTANPAPTDSAVAVPGSQPTIGVASGARVSIDAPAEAAEDFSIDVKVDDVTTPYVAFNVYVTFDPSVLEAIVIKPGTALAPTPDEMFCARAPASAGTVGLGCTILESPSAATNGVLATIRFRRVGAGTSQLHLRTVDEGGAATGTYISTPNGNATPRPDIVVLNDASVIVS